MQKKYYLLGLGILLCLAMPLTLAADPIITGAGATFPYPLYAKWAEVYQKKTTIAVNYQAIGSGGGIKQIQSGTVDFGASDKPLSVAELDKYKLIQFPTVIGAIVPVINIPDLQNSSIQLSGEILADIYLGKINKWRDSRIIALNPDINLPDAPITVVHRSDGSGTTFLFTNYLSKVSLVWKEKVGSDTAIPWPVGIGGKGNEGVAFYVQRIKNSIGYVEYAYAKQNNLTFVQMINKNGHTVSPSINTLQAASANAFWKPATQFAEILTDEPGDEAWPIVGATFIIMPAIASDPRKTKTILAFFDWAYQHAKEITSQMDYVPLPDSVINMVKISWKDRIKDASDRPIWQ